MVITYSCELISENVSNSFLTIFISELRLTSKFELKFNFIVIFLTLLFLLIKKIIFWFIFNSLRLKIAFMALIISNFLLLSKLKSSSIDEKVWPSFTIITISLSNLFLSLSLEKFSFKLSGLIWDLFWIFFILEVFCNDWFESGFLMFS